MAMTLAQQRDQAREQLGDETIDAAIPALTYRFRNEGTRLLHRFLPHPPKAQARLLVFRHGQVDLHVQRWSKQPVGKRLGTLHPRDARLVHVADTREGSTRIEFGGRRLTVLDAHMAALYQAARRFGFEIDADNDARATSA